MPGCTPAAVAMRQASRTRRCSTTQRAGSSPSFAAGNAASKASSGNAFRCSASHSISGLRQGQGRRGWCGQGRHLPQRTARGQASHRQRQQQRRGHRRAAALEHGDGQLPLRHRLERKAQRRRRRLRTGQCRAQREQRATALLRRQMQSAQRVGQCRSRRTLFLWPPHHRRSTRPSAGLARRPRLRRPVSRARRAAGERAASRAHAAQARRA